MRIAMLGAGLSISHIYMVSLLYGLGGTPSTTTMGSGSNQILPSTLSHRKTRLLLPWGRLPRPARGTYAAGCYVLPYQPWCVLCVFCTRCCPSAHHFVPRHRMCSAHILHTCSGEFNVCSPAIINVCSPWQLLDTHYWTPTDMCASGFWQAFLIFMSLSKIFEMGYRNSTKCGADLASVWLTS